MHGFKGKNFNVLKHTRTVNTFNNFNAHMQKDNIGFQRNKNLNY